VRAAARLAAALGPAELVRFARFGLLPGRRLADEEFRGAGGGRLLAGNALHADLSPESAGGGLYGWLLCCLGQQVGYPVPEGGAGQITAALVRRLRARGGSLQCSAPVERVLLRGGRAVGVRIAGGRELMAARAVLADVSAPVLYRRLVGEEHLPAALLEDLRRFQYDNSTVKVDWALDASIPWSAPEARRAGTVHVTEGMDALTEHSADLARGLISARPFLVMGQYATADPTRAPEGKDTAWAYTHVPQRVRGDAGGALTGRWDEQETAEYVQRIEHEVELLAPGFRDRILGRHVFNPRTMEASNANLVGGAINNGTAQLHQQLFFRPTSGFARPETPIDGLYLASASAHPGGGGHGAPGSNAARAALRARGPRGRLTARALRALRG